MTTTSDSTQHPPSRLDDEMIALVRAALRAYLGDGADDPAPLRAALAAMTSEARSKAMLPEQVLVVLKDLWNSLAEVRRMANTGDQIRMQQRVVTMCIKEYYSA